MPVLKDYSSQLDMRVCDVNVAGIGNLRRSLCLDTCVVMCGALIVCTELKGFGLPIYSRTNGKLERRLIR